MKSIICLMLLVFCSISRAATPIDGLYSNIFGGYVYLPGNVNHSYGSGTINAAAYQGGYEAGGSIGYKSNPMRYEGEVTYLKASIKNFAFNSTQITPTRGFDQAVLAMLNIYYDFASLNPILQPYIGGGVGYGWFQGRYNSTTPLVIAFAAQNSAVAFQGMAGVTFNFAENYALNLNYRYIASSHLGTFGSMFQAHVANVGATYRFDGNKYK